MNAAASPFSSQAPFADAGMEPSDGELPAAMDALLQLGIATVDGESTETRTLLAAAQRVNGLLAQRHTQRLRAFGDRYFSEEARTLMLHRRRERAELARLMLMLQSPDKPAVGRAILVACLRLSEELHAEEHSFSPSASPSPAQPT